MGKFEERLFGDLVQHHGAAMSETVRPAPRPSRVHPLWIGAGAMTVAGSIAVAVTVLGGNSPAFAVSKDADGVVTLSIKDIRAVDAANAELRKIGAPVLAVPMRADCADTFEIDETFAGEASGTVSSGSGDEGSVTVRTKGLRPGSTVLVAAKKDGDTLTLSDGFAVRGKAPSCLPDVSDAPGVPGDSAGAGVTVIPVSPSTPGR
jgi:hypothetical protein